MSGNTVKVVDLVPGTVRELPTVQASSLDRDVFWSEFVYKHNPVLIKRAAVSWPALETWRKPGYLESRCGDELAGMSRTFNPLPAKLYFDIGIKHGKLVDYIREMRCAGRDDTYSIPATRTPIEWEKDLGDFTFLNPRFDLPPRFFPRRRLFIYKNASTEWHYHPTDESLMTQIVGAKRVALFRLTPASWATYAQPIEANFHHMNCGKFFFPQGGQIDKYEVVVEEGDALYIPPFWWHGVDPIDTDFGITLAHCFRTPLRRLGDWREPAIRSVLRHAYTSHKHLFAYFLALVALSSLSRIFANEDWLG